MFVLYQICLMSVELKLSNFQKSIIPLFRRSVRVYLYFKHEGTREGESEQEREGEKKNGRKL